MLNTTYCIDPSIEDIWKAWIKETFIPIHHESGFCSCILLKVEEKYDEGGISYALHTTFSNMNTYIDFKSKYESKLNKLHAIKFQGKYAAFTTMLTQV